MFLSVDISRAADVRLEDAENLRELKAVASGLDRRDDAWQDDALGKVGRLDADGNAWLVIEELSALAVSIARSTN